MSYILDALQRADAERERGHVPGLKSQIVPPADRQKVAPVRRWKPVHTIAVLVALVLVAACAWWWSARNSAVPVAAPTPTPAASPAPVVSPPPAAPVVGQATPPAPAVAQPTEPVQPILAPRRVDPPKPRTAVQAPAAAAEAPPSSSPSPAAPASQPVPRTPQTTTTPTAASGAGTAPRATTPAAEPVLVRSFAELSPEARAQLPQVNVSGSTYSQNPGLRMLIVNGKVLHEGQEISPGFKLENIGPRSAVLNHQGMRYSIGY